jgi:hypothetical protein
VISVPLQDDSGDENRTGRVTCAISAATQVPHFSSSRCGSGKRSRPI